MAGIFATVVLPASWQELRMEGSAVGAQGLKDSVCRDSVYGVLAMRSVGPEPREPTTP